MYIPIIIISSGIDIPEASPIIDDEEDMDEGVRDEVVGDKKVIEVTGGKVKDEEDEDKGGALDKGIEDEVEVMDDEDETKGGRVIDEDIGNEEEVMDEEVLDKGAITDEDVAVEVPMYIYNKVHYNYTNEHTLYLSLMY